MNLSTKTILAKLHRSGVYVVLLCMLYSASAQKEEGSQAAPATAAVQAAPQNDATSAAATQAKAHDDTFIIGPDDVLNVNVWKEHDISRSVPVRSDGMISLPLVGEVQAAGKTPHMVEHEIATKLKNYISEPEVTVIVEQIKSQKFNILGMVGHPGSFPLTGSMTVLDAIAVGGGFRDFAKQKSIYVLRKNANGTNSRFPFNYKDVIHGRKMEENIKLQPGDTIVVP